MPALAPARRLAIPRVPGPRLPPFTPTGHADIKFLQRLSSSDARDGYVWKVEIHGNVYALKMFDFAGWRRLRNGPGKYLKTSLTKRQFYYDYFDPFYCECRVYGRLKEEGREDLAVRAHGYLFLTPEQEAEVTGMVHEGQPVRAIVKGLVADDEAFEVKQTAQMWSDLKDLHALGIVVQDIHAANYMGGKLVDFSRAWTMYHPCLDPERVRNPRRNLSLLRVKDWSDLEDMIDATYGYDLKIRPVELHECAAGRRESGIALSLYNWRDKGGKSAVAHVEHELYGDCADASSGDDD